jgi:peroxiredoxin
MKRFAVVSMVLAIAAVGAFLSYSATSVSAPEPGTKVPTFTLKDVEGDDHSLDEYLSHKYVVLMFIATQCPVSNAYNERMVALHRDYGSKGVGFVGINSNRQESVDEIKEHASTYGFTFPVLKDVKNVVADAYGAQVTPEVFVINNEHILCYHGRIDDNRYVEDISTLDLRNTLDALLAGKEVPRAVTKAFGCSIKRVKKEG